MQASLTSPSELAGHLGGGRLALISFHSCPMALPGTRHVGGMNVYVLQQARELGRRGIPTDVFTRWHGEDHPKIMDLGENARLIHLEACDKSQPKELLKECVPEFVERVRTFSASDGTEYGLVHSHYWLSGLAALDLAERWRVPHVATFHTLARTKMRARSEEREPDGRPEAEQAVMRQADTVVVTTEQERTDLERLYRVDGCNVRVIAAGVDLELFRPMDQSEAKDRLGWNGDPTILYVGRIEPLKGVDLVVRALARMENANGVRFVVAGGDPGYDGHMDELRRVARSEGVEDKVTFVGSVEHTELPAYYNAADVFVLPSYYESFGLAALEAMACGTPVVASGVGGLPSFIVSGESGFLVAEGQPDSFRERLDLLLGNAELRECMGQAGRSTAEAMGWGRVMNSLSDLYSELLNGRR